MPDPFIGEIRIFPHNRIPEGWITCDGQLLAISMNQALFSLLGTTFGGNGSTTFGVPDMKGRVPIGTSSAYPYGKQGGEARHALTPAEMPMHTHHLNVSTNKGSADSPVGNVLATAPVNVYSDSKTGMGAMKSVLSTAGKGQPHQNMQPYLTFCYCIATVGLYPSRS